MPIHLIDRAVVQKNLSMPDCIEVMMEAMVAIHQGQAVLPPRLFIALPGQKERVFGVMPGALVDPEICGTKLLTLYSGNPTQGRPAIQGVIILFDSFTGESVALLDAAAITTLRTAAASAVATRVLARDDARILALFGYGVQAESHLQAMLEVRPIDHVLVWGRSPIKAQAFADQQAQRFKIRIEAVDEAQAAAEQADIICTLTHSPEPILKGDWLKPGTHINLVGAHTPVTREADTNTVRQSRVFVETKAFALKEAGDILIPLNAGDIEENHIKGDIAQVILREVQGRASVDDITLYKSLGNTAQDLAAAHAVYSRVKAQENNPVVAFP